MGWRGVVRSIAAEQRRAEREARRRERELQAAQRDLSRMEERQRAAFEVAMYENQIEVLKSLHKDVSYWYDWSAIVAAPPPQQPPFYRTHEQAAAAQLQSYRPGLMDTILGEHQSNRQRLELAVEQARQQDAWLYQRAMEEHQRALERWQWFQNMGRGILRGDIEACRAAFAYLTPFSELNELGIKVEGGIERLDRPEITVKLRDQSILPSIEKQLLASGKLSSKQMTAARINDLYQDHVCSAVLRIAGEMFALLPVTLVVIHAEAPLLSTATGRRSYENILSVAVARETFESIDLDAIDCSDSMRNFLHHMDFKKNRGFAAVARLSLKEMRPS